MKQDDGGPAFPGTYREGLPTGGSILVQRDGMSLRDWLAGQAMNGIVREAFRYMVERPDGDSAQHAVMTDAALRVLSEIGTVAYAQADAMLAARGGTDDDAQ